MRRAVAALALVLVGAPGVGGSGARAEEARRDATIALNFQDVELPVLARFIAEVTGRNVILDDRVRGKVTIISPTRITADEAWAVFQSVLQVKGFTTVPSGSFVKVVPVRDARETTVPTGTGPHAAAGDAVVTRILPLAHADAAALVPVLQPLVSKDGLLAAYPASNSLVVVDAGANVERLAGLLRDLDVPSSERALEVVRLEFAAADDLAPRLREALGGPAGGAGLRVIPDGRSNALVLSGPPDDVRRARTIVARLDRALPPGATRVNVYHLKYAEADGLVRVLSRLIGQPLEAEPAPRPHGSSFMRTSARRSAFARGYDGGMGEPPVPPPPEAPPPAPAATGSAAAVPLEAPVRVTADTATNAVIVSATPEDWETLRRVIEQLDVRRRQVFVEAIILEATLDKLRALGVEFQGGAALDGHTGLAQANFGNLAALAGAGAGPLSLPGLLLAAVSNEKVTLPDGTKVAAHSVLLNALESDADVNVLSAPNIVTTDNEEAEIVVGRNVPFVASRATSASNLSNLFTTIERHDVGITLRMTPQITADDFVRLALFEEVSDIDPTATPAVGDPNLVGPTTTIRSASTSVAARDGQTVVIGGLLADTIRSTERGVPYFRRIPFLGALFRRDDDTRTKTNLLVFLTPHIIASDAQMAENSRREREHMRSALPPGLRRHPKLEGPSWERH
ncbi:MAG TPA: type II secretion system secretin GspD [Candidatus Binatia bacterium]|nr:type II secretion system secretin GspD [Candidatus Binatia bacterium]